MLAIVSIAAQDFISDGISIPRGVGHSKRAGNQALLPRVLEAVAFFVDFSGAVSANRMWNGPKGREATPSASPSNLKEHVLPLSGARFPRGTRKGETQ
jgi:hypothetical protein